VNTVIMPMSSNIISTPNYKTMTFVPIGSDRDRQVSTQIMQFLTDFAKTGY